MAVIGTFSIAECRRLADEILAAPPKKEWIERVAPIGKLVASFVLPLELCKTANVSSRKGTASAGWAIGKMKTDSFRMMYTQNGCRLAKSPLPGRPHLVCIRFSSVPSDAESGWSKNPIDRLRVSKKNGLGIIQDDSRAHVRKSLWWEPCPPKKGFVLLNVYTGDEVKS